MAYANGATEDATERAPAAPKYYGFMLVGAALLFPPTDPPSIGGFLVGCCIGAVAHHLESATWRFGWLTGLLPRLFVYGCLGGLAVVAWTAFSTTIVGSALIGSGAGSSVSWLSKRCDR